LAICKKKALLLKGWIVKAEELRVLSASLNLFILKGLVLLPAASAMVIIIPVPLAIFPSIVINPAQVRSVKIVPVVITSPIHIPFRTTVVITTI